MNYSDASASLSRELLNPGMQITDCMKRHVRREETTYTAPSSPEPPARPRSANAAFTVCHSEPATHRAGKHLII